MNETELSHTFTKADGPLQGDLLLAQIYDQVRPCSPSYPAAESTQYTFTTTIGPVIVLDLCQAWLGTAT
jgi:hypothetical protein